MYCMAETKIVVLDDDPTGIQSVHDVDVLMKFDEQSLTCMMEKEEALVYLSTNSRSLMKEETEALHRTIICNLSKASHQTGRDFLVISRGDSTLRGHYPLESEVIKEELHNAGVQLKGEVLCPYLEGIRKTENDVHYVLSGKEWIPCGQSEFAKDATFSYQHSDLKEYVEEKYGTKMPCVSIGLELLDHQHTSEIRELLQKAPESAKIIVNAQSMSHLNAFVEAVYPVKSQYQYRTAASFVKAFAKIEDIPYLKMASLCDDSDAGGLILAGSHVRKTTEQIKALTDANLVETLELNVEEPLDTQLDEIASKCDAILKKGKNVLVMTSRKRVDFEGDAFEQLKISRSISTQFVSILKRIQVRPRFLISKGGITSYDVLCSGLEAASARVLGQVSRNIPAVSLGKESLHPNMKVVVFPGNVGETETLKQLVEAASKNSH